VKPLLEIQSMPYPDSLLVSWRSGYYTFLLSSGASDYIKSILVAKSRLRPGRRFFGEAFVASKFPMVDGWYSSYKWLTSNKWIEGTGMEDKFQEHFHHALRKYIGTEALTKIQRQARMLTQSNRKSSLKPVPPGL
jgi:hypothetical protein